MYPVMNNDNSTHNMIIGRSIGISVYVNTATISIYHAPICTNTIVGKSHNLTHYISISICNLGVFINT